MLSGTEIPPIQLPSQIRLGGNWIGGISVPDSIQSGLRLAKEISGE
ncbi:MAG: hypothetical protein AAFV78_10055 [Bacteroidota bacterium]